MRVWSGLEEGQEAMELRDKTRAVQAQIDAELRPVEFQIMERLNALPKYPDAGMTFGPIQFVHDWRGFWAAECAVTGSGFWYATLDEAVKRWRVTVVGFDCGKWLTERQG